MVLLSELTLAKEAQIRIQLREGQECAGLVVSVLGTVLNVKRVVWLDSNTRQRGVVKFDQADLAHVEILAQGPSPAEPAAEAVPAGEAVVLRHGGHRPRERQSSHLKPLHPLDMPGLLAQQQYADPPALAQLHLQPHEPFKLPPYRQTAKHLEGDKFEDRILIEFKRIRDVFWAESELPPTLRTVPEKLYFIDTFHSGAFQFALTAIEASTIVGVALAGQIHRQGSLSLLTVATQTQLFLFDIFQLGLEAFERGLGEFLASPMIMKVMHDVRLPSDYFYHECGITLANIYDTAAAHALFVTWKVYAGYLPKFCSSHNHLAKAYFGLTADSLHFPHVRATHGDEDLSVWFERPLSPGLREATIRNTMYLLDLQRATRECMMRPFFDATESMLQTVRDSDDMDAQIQLCDQSVMPRTVLDALPRLKPNEDRASRVGVALEQRRIFQISGQGDNNVIFSRDCMHQKKA